MQHSDFFALLLRRRWILVAVFAITLGAHALLLQSSPATHVTEALLRVRERSPAAWNGPDFQGLEIYEPFSTQILSELIADPRFADDVRVALEDGGVPAEVCERWRASRLKLEPEKGTDFVRVTYSGPRAADLGVLLEASLEAARRSSQRFFEGGLARGRERLVERLNREGTLIAELDGELRTLWAEAGIDSHGKIDDLERSLAESLEALDLKEVELRAECAELSGRLAEWTRRKESVPTEGYAVLGALQGTPVYGAIQDISTQLIRAELALARKAQRLKEAHPELKQARLAVEAEKALFASVFAEGSPFSGHIEQALVAFADQQDRAGQNLASGLLAVENRWEGVRTLRREKQARAQRLRTQERAIREHDERRAAHEHRRSGLEESLRQLDLFSHLAPEVVQVFRPPGAPRSLGHPLPRNLPFVLVLAALIACGVCYGLEYFDHRIHDQHVLRRHTELPLLGTIPRLRDAEYVPPPGRPSPGVEALNAILKKALVGLGDGKVLLVSGPDAAAGKSFFAAHLAVTASRLGLETLLVDGDIRQPRQAERFHLPRSPGLTEFLDGGEDLRREALEDQLARVGAGRGALRLRPEELMAVGSGDDLGVLLRQRGLAGLIRESGHSRLSVLCSGAPVEDPSVLLASPAFESMLGEIRQRFDLCVIDSPPLTLVSDALLVAPRVDGTVLLLRAGKSTSPGLHWTRQSLADVDATVIGTVLNDLERRRPGYYAYYRGRRSYRAHV